MGLSAALHHRSHYLTCSQCLPNTSHGLANTWIVCLICLKAACGISSLWQRFLSVSGLLTEQLQHLTFKMMMPRTDTEEISPMEAEKKRMDISFRVSWSQAILFGCYEVTVSFVLVVISMLYYEKATGPALPALLSTVLPATLSTITTTSTMDTPTTLITAAYNESISPTSSPTTTSTTTTSTLATTTTPPHTLCGSLFPTWQSAAWLVAFYSVVYLAILLANIHFIRQTKKKVHSKVSLFVILTHPAGRLLLGIIAFFITCAFAAPVDEEKGTLNQYINRISMHVTKTAMVVDAGFVIFFIVAIVKRENLVDDSRESIWLLTRRGGSNADEETDWLKLGTHVY